MAVPKKRTGKMAQAHRRANWKGSLTELVKCKNCSEMKMTHRVCDHCGFYGKSVASIKQ